MNVRLYILSALMCCALLTSAVRAEEVYSAEGIITYREKVMDVLKYQSGAIGAILKNKLPYGDDVLVHAKGLQATSRLVAPSFKLKAMKDGGGARAEIWAQWDEYVAAAKVLEEAADRLVAAAETGDTKATAQAMRAVGGSCSSCHKPFRIKHANHRH